MRILDLKFIYNVLLEWKYSNFYHIFVLSLAYLISVIYSSVKTRL